MHINPNEEMQYGRVRRELTGRKMLAMHLYETVSKQTEKLISVPIGLPDVL